MDEIAQYWLILKRRWLPAALVFALTTALAAAYTAKQTPIYQAKGQVILKKTNKTAALLGGANGPMGGLGDIEALGGNNPVTTQAEIIKSLTTVKGVLQGLLGDKYKNASKEQDRLQKYLKDPEKFLTQLKVNNVKGTDILEVTFQDPSPKLTQDVINKVMAVYIDDDQTNQRREAKSARQYVSKKLPEIENEVKIAENDLRVFKERHSVVDLPTEAQQGVETITNLNKEITSASAQLAAETSRLQNLQNLFGKDAQATIQSGLVSESPGLQKSLKELQEVESRLALQKTRFSENDPSVIALQEQRDALRGIVQKRFEQSLVGDKQFQGKLVELQAGGLQGNLIADYAKSEAQRTSLQQQIYALVSVVDAYRKRMNAIPRLEQQQTALTRKLETTRTTYRTMLGRLQEIQIMENQTLGNSRVQTYPDLPVEPISPKKAQNIAIGGFLGLFLGAAVAFALDSTDKRIKTVEEAKRLLPGYPVLGSIPIFEKALNTPVKLGSGRTPGTLVLADNATTGVEAESFRMLQTNLQFLNADSSLRSIVMTSSQPGEGKSTVAANLALAAAELGKRVLLVDGDMRKPTQHQIWRRSNSNGLSSLLTGQCDETTAVKEVHANLFLLNAGMTPPNPVALLDSALMASYIDSWSEEFDLVILDAPPLTIASDATLMGKNAGGLLFILRPSVAQKDSVEYCQEMLTQSKINVLGVVHNGVEIDKSRRYSNYYYSATNRNPNTTGSKLQPKLGSDRV
jgi:polysaccharide biosynthesis transport protein